MRASCCPCCKIAGAGSGKTRVPTRRVVHALEEDPHLLRWNTLVVTFTRKAAGELRQRLLELGVGDKVVRAGTFHSVCARILRWVRR